LNGCCGCIGDDDDDDDGCGLGGNGGRFNSIFLFFFNSK